MDLRVFNQLSMSIHYGLFLSVQALHPLASFRLSSAHPPACLLCPPRLADLTVLVCPSICESVHETAPLGLRLPFVHPPPASLSVNKATTCVSTSLLRSVSPRHPSFPPVSCPPSISCVPPTSFLPPKRYRCSLPAWNPALILGAGDGTATSGVSFLHSPLHASSCHRSSKNSAAFGECSLFLNEKTEG